MTEQNTFPSQHEYIRIDDILELRALADEDAQRMFDLTVVNRQYLAAYLPWAEKTESVNDSLSFIEKTKQERANGEGYGFGILVSGKVVGHISLMNLGDKGSPEIGYWIAESFSGNGITTKSAKAVSDFGLNGLGLERITIRARPSNAGSNKIAENLGYKFDGVHKDKEGTLHNRWIIEKHS